MIQFRFSNINLLQATHRSMFCKHFKITPNTTETKTKRSTFDIESITNTYMRGSEMHVLLTHQFITLTKTGIFICPLHIIITLLYIIIIIIIILSITKT